MSCNRCAATAEAVAPSAGAGSIEANWANHRAHPQQCEKCGGFLRVDGGCTRCENSNEGSSDATSVYTQLSCGHTKRTTQPAGGRDWCTVCDNWGAVSRQLGQVPQAKPPRKMAVIAPDQWSGELFHNVLAAAQTQADLHLVTIAPRVIGDQVNQSPQVAEDLAAAIKAVYDQGYRRFSIACNTLHYWLDDALAKIPDIAGEMDVVSNITIMKDKYAGAEKKPTWLGTTVSCRHTTLVKDAFPTPDSQGQPELQDLVQQVIWDAKENLFDNVPQLVDRLHRAGITHIVAGCTELPGAFASMPTHGLTIDDPADAVAAESGRRQQRSRIRYLNELQGES